MYMYMYKDKYLLYLYKDKYLFAKREFIFDFNDFF